MKFHVRTAAALLLLCLFAGMRASALNVADLLEADVLSELEEKGFVEKSYYSKKSDFQPSLAPNTALAQKASKSWPEDQEPPVFLVEQLYLMPKDKIGSGNPANTTIDHASKVLRSISKMEGMKYYSYGSGKIETLYKQSFCTAGPGDRTRVPDDTAGSAEGKIVYCMHDDHSFGKIDYRIVYHQRPDEVHASFVNTSDVRVGPIKAVLEGNLRMDLVMLDCGDKMMVYMVVQSKFPAIKILESTMYESFNARLNAIYKWFNEQF